MRSFLLELKSYVRSFKFLAFILVLLSYQAMLVTQFEAENVAAEVHELRANERYLSEHRSFAVYWGERQNDNPTAGKYSPFSRSTIDYNLRWYQYETGLAEKIARAYVNTDWDTYNRYWAERRLLEWSMYGMNADLSNIHCPYISPEDYFGSKLGVIGTMVEDPELDSLPIYSLERFKIIPEAEQVVLTADLHLQLLEKGLAYLSSHSISPWGFMFNYLRRGLPNVLGLIALLMTVNILHRERKFGSIKSTLQVPRSRSYYLLRKFALGSLTSVLVVVIPLFLMFIGLGIKTKGFKGLNSPVLLDTNFLNWSVDPEHLRLLRWTYSFSNVGLSEYANSLTGFDAASRMEFIPLWQFLILAIVILAAYTFLFAVVGILISILVKHDIFAQITAVSIFALGTVFGTVFPKLETTTWDLFSKANAIPLLEGNQYSTFLSSLAALCLATVLLYGVSVLLFRKMDITTG